MNRFTEICLLLHACILLYSGNMNQALMYDHSATTECLVEPQTVQYGGGIINNPDFNNGIKGWMVFGQGKVEQRKTQRGNMFIAAFDRKHLSDSFSQTVQLVKGKLYALSAWIQISGGRETVSVVFRTPGGGLLHGGAVIAEHGCWSMLKGGIVANFTGPADLLFKIRNTDAEIWADNISLQPFTKKQWRSHQDKIIAKERKSNVKFHVSYGNKTAISDARIMIKQTKSAFPLGCEINQNILNSTAYQNWFTSRFTVTAFGNEMKWYSTEKIRGQENYTIADAMVEFVEQNNISIRGHNIFWDDPKYQPDWVPSLAPEELQKAAEERIESVVLRYKGKLIAWDVVNENLHFRFFEDKLGENASAAFYASAHQLDQSPLMFMNEYNTIENSEDEAATPAKYVEKLKNILLYPGNDCLPAGIGLQSRFGPGQPNLPYMRAAMDILAAMKFPLWLTEAFVDKGENQAQYLEEVLREGYSHPAVEGIVIWPTSPFSECKMCLTDKNFQNTPNGDVVDELIDEWSCKPMEIATSHEGFSEISLFHGDYEVTVTHPDTKSSTTMNLKVTKDNSENSVYVQMNAFVPHACYTAII
ncbi:hypothetical protein Nepgr_004931 [Nepenthes gracilis]|uniref:GH10 domain-containing protein n=1 Tax=Nepenthes gracilis TaxID=150966 RepID=A0AAD3S2I7_NEPGR|nr:hypothetical protein Nepgr_004931 [Nepenthes gracilis]